ncbi:MAG: sigma-54-dependent Fis family transcriptional regulator [Betaproteobacteria bacterium]|nr:sigma-54-dependent Fis family transcriptional regulator [Betaproteobacteria bacterium]
MLVYWSLTDDQFDIHKDRFPFPYNERNCLIGITTGKHHVKGFDGCTCAVTPDKWGLGWCAATNTPLYIPDLRTYQNAELTAAPETDYLWGVGSCIYLPIPAETSRSRGDRTVLGVLVIYSPIHNLFGTEHLIRHRTGAPLPAGISNVNSNPKFFDALREIIDTGPLRNFILDLRQRHEARNATILERARAIETTIVGISEEIIRLREDIARIAPDTSAVLITGDSGSGKELVAQALHQHGAREGNFIRINIAAIPKDLLESHLFGYERDAHSRASKRQFGYFEEARNGTLFLDEIGDMEVDLQTRLLRVLSDGHFHRLGGKEEIDARNVRVIAATNRELWARVRMGLFREDLYHRLNVIRVRVPSLRERVVDIPVLTGHFLREAARKQGVVIKRLSVDAETRLCEMPWRGSVRELENLCKSLTTRVDGMVIRAEDIMSASVTALEDEDQPAGSESRSGIVRKSSTADDPVIAAPNAPLAGIALDDLRGRIKEYCGKSLPSNSASEKEKLRMLLLEAIRRLKEPDTDITGAKLAELLGISRNDLHKKLLGYIGMGMPELKELFRYRQKYG